MMKRCFLVVLIGSMLTGFSYSAQPDDDEVTPSRVGPLMRMKLERSKAILEGLTTEDYVKIASNARALKLLSMESGWNVIQTPDYTKQSEDFRRVADMVAEAANSRDIGRAALEYLSLTVRCIDCHSYMRRQRAQ